MTPWKMTSANLQTATERNSMNCWKRRHSSGNLQSGLRRAERPSKLGRNGRELQLRF